MPCDIFISYSRQDSAQALTLAENLRSSGMQVWIDQHGIEAATSWSKEIVSAIEECQAFCLLLSDSALASNNVVKELALAGEFTRAIVPIELHPVKLTNDFHYQLAGLQRVAITDFEAILRALKKLGIIQNPLLFKEGAGGGYPYASDPQPANPCIVSDAVLLEKEGERRKSLMILPFDDLSPTADNAWFADGLANELISALSNVKALRVTDQQTTKEYKKYTGHLTTYAKEMSIRYFVQGDVRKFGDNIKITSRLLDIQTGDHLWQDSMKGTMNDIFDIQEKVAEKVVEGLKVHLASDEKKKLAEHGTENAEAYELVLKAREYAARHTQEGYQLAIQLLSEAIELDPSFASAYAAKAHALAALCDSYNRDPALLEEGLDLITQALRLKPDLWKAYGPLSHILQLQGKLEEAEQTAKEYIRNAPEDSSSHFALGFFYGETGESAKVITLYEQAVKLKPDNLTALFNLIVSCNGAKEVVKQRHWSEVAIPIFEKHLKLFPDDENQRVNHALLLYWAGRDNEARGAARRLENLRDGTSLYNTASLQCRLEDYEAGLKTFRKAIEAGFRSIRHLKAFLTDDDEGIGKLKGTPGWEEVRLMVEKIEAEQLTVTNTELA